ncbi:hypothetical protein OH77DRAFT_1397660 [Trametes cingulata]|nr:hypothetical protein OH77DRAFT_1397660 [Trametes cingulata]
MVSVHNPFRTPTVTPTPPGASVPTQSTSSSTSATLLDSHNVPSGTSGSYTPGSQTTASGSVSPPDDRSVNDLLTEELPPPYTPAPNVYEGETTLELGPRRPFQNAAPAPPRNQPGWPPPEATAASTWTAFPGSRHRESSNIYTHPAPPPVHPASANWRPSSTPIASPPHPVSDFARDFYAAGADVNSGVLGGPSAQYQGEAPGAPSSSSSTRYAPPPGEPPNRSAKSASASPVSPSGDGVPDDGRPTDKPVPGHPLLRHGRILVYPKDYECHKCHNTGYKNYDPSHPCSRCWDKYSKPYSGAMAYAPWGPDGQSGPSSSRHTFQRPLPQFRAPQASLHQQSASYAGLSPPPRSDLSRSASTSRITGAYPGAAARVIPIPGGGVPMSPYLDPAQNRGNSVFPPAHWYGTPPVVPVRGVPPPSGNVAVYPPGDPRIGGRLCWRCGGSGKTSFLIFDEETCGVCNGVGRTFV